MFELLRRRSFEAAARAYSADLYRFAYWLCRDRFLAEELVQETFTRAWDAWRDVRDPASTKAWLFTILRRENARRFERRRLELVDGNLDDMAEMLDARPSANRTEDEQALRDAVARLPTTVAEPLLLQVLGGFDCAEIARQLDTTPGAVMTRVCRARSALRRILSDAETTKGGVRAGKAGPR